MTTFYFVRHGEPDYGSVGTWSRIPFGRDFACLTQVGVDQICKAASQLSGQDAQIIISSPFTRAMHGATIISRALDLPVFVEKDLHEWQSDLTHEIVEDEKLLMLCRDFDACNGIYPNGAEKLWESREMVRKRVLTVLEKYAEYEKVIVMGHAIMIQTITGEKRPFEYGEVVVWKNGENEAFL